MINWIRKIYNMKIYSKEILKVISNINYAILYRIFILIQDKLEDKQLTEINKYSEEIFKKYILNNDEIREEDRELLSNVMADEKIKELLSLKFLLNSYYYGVFHIEDDEELYYKKALKIKDNLTKLNKKTFYNQKKIVKKIENELKQEFNKITKERIERRKFEETPKVRISTENINFILKICSLFFIVGGFLYTYFFMAYFNINISLYYNISDYIAGSMDVLFNIFIILIVLSIFMAFEFDNMLNKEFFNDEYGISSSKSYTQEYLVFGFFFVTSILNYLITNTIETFLVIMTLVMLFYIVLPKIKILNYLEKPIPIVLSLIGIILFISQLALRIDKDIKSVLKNEKKVSIKLKYDYTKFEELSLITINSNYLFFWDKEKKKSIVIPLSRISNLDSIEIRE
ncbi:hypothetical protein [Arcobacter sp. LA11]|uniref:hypothetical protein n=1 Tax=Arcobacter sp. LA11 TaxID=1898176 RepID=UPI0009352E48|nr:hypothetical protein [Arcobacter sp. LA11]